jgi:hypothetical protein
MTEPVKTRDISKKPKVLPSIFKVVNKPAGTHEIFLGVKQPAKAPAKETTKKKMTGDSEPRS